MIVPPTVLKKYVTGKGNASKEHVLECVIRKWFDDPPSWGSYDLYDAYALMKFGKDLRLGSLPFSLSQKVVAYDLCYGEFVDYKGVE